MDKPVQGQLRRLAITGYAADGAGVARLNGQVVFVQGGVRGEECLVRLTHVGRTAPVGDGEGDPGPLPRPGGAGLPIFPPGAAAASCGT